MLVRLPHFSKIKVSVKFFCVCNSSLHNAAEFSKKLSPFDFNSSWLLPLIGPLVARLLFCNAIKDTASAFKQDRQKQMHQVTSHQFVTIVPYKGEMNAAGKTVSTSSGKECGKRTHKDGENSHERETTLDKQMAKIVPNDVREAMDKLTFEEKQSIYLDIFKPIDFHELLFDRCFNNETKFQPATP